MNRREMLQQTVAALSAIGVACDLTAESLDPKPALIVLRHGPMTSDQHNDCLKMVGELMKQIGGDIPALILPDNADLTFMDREQAIAFMKELEVVRYRSRQAEWVHLKTEHHRIHVSR